MHLSSVLVFCACVALGSARSAPHADLVEELMKSDAFSDRISNNILEDASLSVPDLIAKYEYPVEVHTVQTEDGYFLQMHRIPHGRDRNNDPNQKRPVVFVMHGLLSSSADFVLMGPGCGLAYILAEEGFDVWMGNARGNFYSRRHISLNPNSILNTNFWDFSWDEIGNFDLPAMIDYALEHTGKSRLHYIGHSQGTTSFFVFGSLRPDYGHKIISMHALAPVAYMAHNSNQFFGAIAPFAKQIESLASIIGIGEFMPNGVAMSWAGQALCRDEAMFQPLCSNILFLIGGWNFAQHNATMFPVKLGHTPAGASVKQIAHYGQSITDKGFQRYDHGWLKNRRIYGSTRPPSYDLKKIQVPVFLHYSDKDVFAHVNDVQRLFADLGTPVGLFRVNDPDFSHLDFMWGIDAKELIYNRVINLIWAMDN